MGLVKVSREETSSHQTFLSRTTHLSTRAANMIVSVFLTQIWQLSTFVHVIRAHFNRTYNNIVYITGLTQSIPLGPWDLSHNLHSIVEREIAWASVLNLRELQNGNNRGFLQKSPVNTRLVWQQWKFLLSSFLALYSIVWYYSYCPSELELHLREVKQSSCFTPQSLIVQL